MTLYRKLDRGSCLQLKLAGIRFHDLTSRIVQSPALSAPLPTTLPASALDNRLQLPSIAQRVLNDLITCDQDILAQVIVLLLREVYPAILDHPAALLSEVDDAAFGVEEEERLGVGYGDGGVCALAAGRDFLADGANEDLYHVSTPLYSVPYILC
jgi:hypothetical protein